VGVRTVKVWLSAAALVVAIGWTGWDFATNKTEPFHVLMLSWLALDISLVQVLLAALTRRHQQEHEGQG
jgi:hypothetical protein